MKSLCYQRVAEGERDLGMDGVRGPWLFPGGTFQGQVCRHLGLEKSCGAWRVVEEAVPEQWERRDG